MELGSWVVPQREADSHAKWMELGVLKPGMDGDEEVGIEGTVLYNRIATGLISTYLPTIHLGGDAF